MIKTNFERSRDARRSERGATAVETAIVLPLLMILFFGVLEFGLMFRNAHSLSDASRSGARTASAMSRIDGYETLTADAVAAALRGEVPDSAIDHLTIFNADPLTGKPKDGNDYESCVTGCWQFDWDAANSEWVSASTSSWPAADQAACGDRANTDYLGVYVSGTYRFATGLFGANRKLNDVTVMRLEPLPSASTCSPTP